MNNSTLTRGEMYTDRDRYEDTHTDLFPTFPSTPGGKYNEISGLQVPQYSGSGSGPNDEWFDDGDTVLDSTAIARVVARLIMLLLLYIQRFEQNPTQLITFQILAGKIIGK